MDKYTAYKKECNDFIEEVLALAKERGFGCLLGVGKYYKDVDKTIVMSGAYEHPSCALHALTKILIQPGTVVGHNIALSILECGFDITEASKEPYNKKH
jgi:hypothetical protein